MLQCHCSVTVLYSCTVYVGLRANDFNSYLAKTAINK